MAKRVVIAAILVIAALFFSAKKAESFGKHLVSQNQQQAVKQLKAAGVNPDKFFK